MNRCLETEWLDELPATDARARSSRHDLRRLNRWMGNAGIMATALSRVPKPGGPTELIELGAGDGDFLLRVARRLGSSWQGTRATLLDRQQLVTEATIGGFNELGWDVAVAMCDVFNWYQEAGSQRYGVVVANLFLHHFDSGQLTELLHGIARGSIFFAALEPRRSLLSLVFSRLVGLIGCNAVTRHDAPASVRAGFRGAELSQIWPHDSTWSVRERTAGAFGHLFVAQQTGASQVS